MRAVRGLVTAKIAVFEGQEAMTTQKDIRREVSAFWKSLKQERRERSKLDGAADLAESSRRLARFAADLEKLSGRAAWSELKASQPAKAKPKKDAKAKPATDAKAKAKRPTVARPKRAAKAPAEKPVEQSEPKE